MIKKVGDDRIITISGTPDDWILIGEIIRAVQENEGLAPVEDKRADWLCEIAEDIAKN